ncbi:MAG: carboxypeptidase-like regulatory domain-containing protein [Armatimonadetes bacterium]|nr:carboxypeptidase-like regulatory domain-containing protein [Armatimonadota bacterium]
MEEEIRADLPNIAKILVYRLDPDDPNARPRGRPIRKQYNEDDFRVTYHEVRGTMETDLDADEEDKDHRERYYDATLVIYCRDANLPPPKVAKWLKQVQFVTVSGALSGTNVGGVLLEFMADGQEWSTVTDASGNYTIELPKAGTATDYVVRVRQDRATTPATVSVADVNATANLSV